MSRAFCCDALLCGSVSDAIRPVLAVPGAQRGPKGGPKMIIFTCWPFRAPKQPRSFHPLEFSGFLHKRPRSIVSPSGLRPILAVSQNAFRPGDPRNGPKSRFCFKDPTIIWENGNLGALVWALFLLGERQKVIFPFRPPKNGRNGPIWAIGGKN